MSIYPCKYATATHIYVPIPKRGVTDFAVGADWTPASGDVKISIDGGAAANLTNLPTAIVMGNTAQWDFSLTSSETTGKKISITVADSATKAVEDQFLSIETYGHASAQYQADYSLANLPANVVQLLGTAWLAPATAGTPDVNVISGAITAIQSGLATAAALAALAAKFTGITLVARWLGLLAGKTADSTTLAEVQATVAGAGYDNTTDSMEAIRDRGDVSWLTGSAGDTLIVAPILATQPSSVIRNSGTNQAFRYSPLPSGPLVIVDSAGAAIDLSTWDLKMLCRSVTQADQTFTLTLTDGDLSVGGTDHNYVYVDYTPTVEGKYKRTTFGKPSGGSWRVIEIGYWQIEDSPDPNA